MKNQPQHEPPFPALQIHQLTVNYGRTPVLWDISMQIPQGKIVGIIGPNGAGKSTLVKAVLGLIKPSSGKVEVLGAASAQARGRIAYVPQRESVDWDFPIDVQDLVMMGRYGTLGICQRPGKSDYAAVGHYLEEIGLSAYANRQISELSGGQQQRAFLARALVQEADIIFMDEPFAGIDMATESTMMNILRQLREKGKTIFVVHHDLNTVESYFDWIVMLNMRLVACGSVFEAFNADTLNMTYGKSYAILDEALKLSQSRTAGM